MALNRINEKCGNCGHDKQRVFSKNLKKGAVQPEDYRKSPYYPGLFVQGQVCEKCRRCIFVYTGNLDTIDLHWSEFSDSLFLGDKS